MNYRVGNIGRIIWVRLDDGEDLRLELERIALRENVNQALVMALGAMKKGSVVVGPKEAVIPPEPVWKKFADGREILGMGTMVKGPDGPSLHMHMGLGRGDEPTVLGCIRESSEVYLIAEAVIIEVEGIEAERQYDPAVGLNLLTFLKQDF